MAHPVGAALAFAAALLSGSIPLESPSGAIEGTIRDRAGTPIANAQVQILDQPFSALTDSAGEYRLTAVPVGTYRMRATSRGYRAAELGGISVHAGGTTRADFTLEPATRRDEMAASPGEERQRAELDRAATMAIGNVQPL